MNYSMIRFLSYERVCRFCEEEFREKIETPYGLRYCGCKCSDVRKMQEEELQMHLREQFGVDDSTTFY